MIRLVCPVDVGHGSVLPVKDPESRYGWFCPHAAHDGRLAGHPQGPAPRTRAHFTTDEIQAGALRSRLDDSTADLGVGARGDARAESGAPGIAPAGDHGVYPPIRRGSPANQLIQACEPGAGKHARSVVARLGALDLFPETPGHPGHATG